MSNYNNNSNKVANRQHSRSKSSTQENNQIILRTSNQNLNVSIENKSKTMKHPPQQLENYYENNQQITNLGRKCQTPSVEKGETSAQPPQNNPNLINTSAYGKETKSNDKPPYKNSSNNNNNNNNNMNLVPTNLSAANSNFHSSSGGGNGHPITNISPNMFLNQNPNNYINQQKNNPTNSNPQNSRPRGNTTNGPSYSNYNTIGEQANINTNQQSQNSNLTIQSHGQPPYSSNMQAPYQGQYYSSQQQQQQQQPQQHQSSSGNSQNFTNNQYSSSKSSHNNSSSNNRVSNSNNNSRGQIYPNPDASSNNAAQNRNYGANMAKQRPNSYYNISGVNASFDHAPTTQSSEMNKRVDMSMNLGRDMSGSHTGGMANQKTKSGHSQNMSVNVRNSNNNDSGLNESLDVQPFRMQNMLMQEFVSTGFNGGIMHDMNYVGGIVGGGHGNNTNISHLSVKEIDNYEDLQDDPMIDFDDNYDIKLSNGLAGKNYIMEDTRKGQNSQFNSISSSTNANNSINKNVEVNFSAEAINMLNTGKKYFKENNNEEAIKAFSEALIEEPSMCEAQYLLGVCYLSKSSFKESIREFTALISKNPAFKKNVYLLIAIAYQKLGDVEKATQMLGKAIQNFPQYYDAYIYRGQMFVQIKKYDLAQMDFNTAIQLNENRGLGFVGMADCLRFTNEFNEAIQLYTRALGKQEVIQKVALLQRAITYIEAKRYNESVLDLNEVRYSHQNEKINIIFLIKDTQRRPYKFRSLLFQRVIALLTMYFKNSLNSNQFQIICFFPHSLHSENYNDAILCFEQAIQHNNSQQAVTKALYEIAKIKIELRDYYAAFYTLNRADYLDVDQKSLEQFRIFTDGVTFLMKRKHQQGIEKLSNLVKNHSLGDFLKPLVYSYRAYGYICLGQYQKALNDLVFIESTNKLDKSSTYNKCICQGIISAQNNKFEVAMNFFNRANKLYPSRMEPFFYKGLTLIKFTYKLIDKQDQKKRLQYIQNALKNLDKGVELNAVNANLFFHRGLLRFSLGMINDAIADIDKAIDKSEDNIPQYFFVRGLAYACCKCFKQAISDFTITINLDESYTDAYLNRAKSYHLVGDRNSAFVDLQKYISFKPSDPDIHLWAGNLLFNIGACEDAVKAYSHANNIAKNQQILMLRTKCYMVLKELNSALADMGRLIEVNNDQNIIYDRECLNSLKAASATSQNVDDETKTFHFNQSLQKIKKAQIEAGPEGHFFLKSDAQFYQGVYHLYLGKYEKALKNFMKSLDLKKEVIQKLSMMPKSLGEEISMLMDQDEDGSAAPGKEQTPDTGDALIQTKTAQLTDFQFENRTYNIYEYHYNVMIAYMLMKRFNQAFKEGLILQEMIPDDETRKNLQIILMILSEETEIGENQNLPLSEQAQELENVQSINVFPVTNRLCSIFPSIRLPFTFLKSPFEVKLSFCLPYIESPSMLPMFDEKLLESLSPTNVENKPQAPWIRRTSEGIVFTDNVQYFEDLDLKTQSQRSADGEAEEGEDENIWGEGKKILDSVDLGLGFGETHSGGKNYFNGNNQEYGGQDDEDSPNAEQFDQEKLKKDLQLDKDIEEKLAKILNKGKK